MFERFRARNILVRRYFYPLISAFPMYRGLESAREHKLPVANSVSNRILCLPIFDSLTDEEITHVLDVIVQAAKGIR